MKFSCHRESFLQALSVVQKAVGGIGVLPVLENILIVAEGQRIELSATNLEISITTTVSAKVVNEGKTTIPAKTLISWVKLAPGEEMGCTRLEGEKILFQALGTKTTLFGVSADEFPILPVVEKEEIVVIDKKIFSKALEQVVFCAAAFGTRPVLSGILFIAEEKNITLVGTDSYRLSEKKIPLKKGVKNNVSCIIPAKTLLDTERILLSEEEGDVEIVFSKHQILLSFNSVKIISRVIEGNFPNYQQILPKGHQNEVSVSRQELIQTVRRVGIFARENNNNIKLFCSKEEMRITTDATEIGTEESVISIKSTGGESAVALNAQFLLDILLVFKDPEVLLRFGEKLNPIMVCSKNEEGLTHIIMPLKI
ncbi:DNA polymerase III subunit beta [Candidatus Peregrinibacteria bacterium]|nr:MAG: DNA polymerase III subunit beta [Candidatus Peregrinibacteria bacterium]